MIEDQNAKINQQRDEILQQRDELNKQRDEINYLRTMHETKPDAVGPASTNSIQNAVHACANESVTLQCVTPNTITVLRGKYGHYDDDSCTSGCCEPSDTDCAELMAESHTEEWNHIKASCDGKTACDYAYPGHITTGCLLNDTANYVELVYRCSNTAAFSVYENWGYMVHEGQTLKRSPNESLSSDT